MPFLSLEFSVLTIGAAWALTFDRDALRTFVFAVLSAAFAWTFLTPLGRASTTLFILLGFGIARCVQARPRLRGAGLVFITAVFVFLKGYPFATWIVPGGFWHPALATAGLSFLFFKILQVVIEAGSRTLPEVRFSLYINYCLSFTTFLMGPIQRYQDFRDQWNGEKRSIEPTLAAHLDAVNRILRGLVKVFVIARMLDGMRLGYAHDLATMPYEQILLKTYLFYVFLYFEFSGYCDIVIGAGSLVGNRPPENFRLPFFSPNISEFWLRVHRSLTEWLTNYVFNPVFTRLLRSRMGRGRPVACACLALMTTMLVSGLWHGTTLNFLLFGLLHGFYLVAFRIYDQWLTSKLGRKRARRLRSSYVSYALGVLLTFNVSAIAYFFFATSPEQLSSFWSRLMA